jgi:mono/diheme cytochrome c family protein
MRKALAVALIVALAVLAAAVLVRGRGVTARRTPTTTEARLAKAAWRFLVPADVRDRANPLPPSPEVIRAGLEHWADHCAICHDNNGSGETQIGRNLHPRAPDMRAAPTQELTDGELFYAIEQGIPFTGMPAWTTGTGQGEHASWELVHFIRHLPKLSAKELKAMEALNPRSPAETRRQRDIDDFLKGTGKEWRRNP